MYKSALSDTCCVIIKMTGSFIGKIPVVKDGPVDEFLIGVGDSISDAEKKQLEKTLGKRTPGIRRCSSR